MADVINHREACPALLQERQHFHDKLPFSRRLRLSWEIHSQRAAGIAHVHQRAMCFRQVPEIIWPLLK